MNIKLIIITFLIVLSSCKYLGNTQVNDIFPDWQYIRSDDSMYGSRNKEISGNCVDYSKAAYRELLIRGYDRSRIKPQSCKVNGEGHMVVILDGHKVYSVGETWVLEKDHLDWEWLSK